MGASNGRPRGWIQRAPEGRRDLDWIDRRVQDVRLVPPAGLPIPDVDRRQVDRGRLHDPTRAVAQHRVGDPQQAPVRALPERVDRHAIASLGRAEEC